MATKKPVIRFDGNIFQDVKTVCDNKSVSRDFELDLSSFNENKKNKKNRKKKSKRSKGSQHCTTSATAGARFENAETLESQRRHMISADNSSAHKGRRPLEKQQIAKSLSPDTDMAQDDINNSSDGKENSSEVDEISTSKKPEKQQGCTPQKVTSLDSDPSHPPVAKLKTKKVVQHQESSDDELFHLDQPSSSTAPSMSRQTDSSTTTSHPGFCNPSLMCYMNATLQALFASTEFSLYMSEMDLNPHDDSNHGILGAITWLSMLVSEDNSLDVRLNIDKAVKYVGRSLAQKRLKFNPNTQHDAHEFAVKMLEALQSDILKHVDDERDICKDLFLLTSSFLPSICTSCEKNVSPSSQLEHLIYYIDMLGSKEGESIQELIDKSLVEEFEQRCCQNDMKCLSRINSLPLILLVGLKRYTQARNKICTPLEISTELILAKFKAERSAEGSVIGSDDDDDEHSTADEKLHTDQVYRLVGIVNHSGSRMTRGHYTAYVHNRMEDAWVLCDDEKTKKVDLSMALCDSVERCYLLVYEAVYEKDMKNTRLTKSGNNTNDEDATASTYSSSDLENVVPKLECD